MIILKINDYFIKKATPLLIAKLVLAFTACLFLSGCFGMTPTPLNQAAWDNDVEEIKRLVASGEPVDEVAPCPRKVFKVLASSPLDLAVLQGNLEAVQALLDSGADVNLSRYCHAIMTSPEEFPMNPSQGYYGFKGSALMLSSLLGDIEITKLLLESGAEVNQLTEKGLWGFPELNDFDALAFSAEFGHSEVTKLLLDFGADPSISSYRAIDRGLSNYLILLLEEDALKIKTDPEYMHYNAELAHIAANFHVETNEKKSLQFYKQAIELYPGAAKHFESLADDKELGEFGAMMLFAAATAFNQYAAMQGVATSGSFPGTKYSFYKVYDYDPNWSEAEYFREKAKQSERNRIKCQEIVACYEEKNPVITLAHCVEETFKGEEKNLSTMPLEK